MGNTKSGESKAAIRSALRDVWIADKDRDGCYNCRAPFRLTLRRHHCRACGELFCKQCWGAVVDLPEALFGELDPSLRLKQPVCSACSTVLSLEGSLGPRIWNGGIAVRVVDAELKARRGSKAEKIDLANTKEDVYVMRLERWRPFNRLTCLFVDRVADTRRRSASTPLSPRHNAPARSIPVSRGAHLATPGGFREAPLPSSMPHSLSRSSGREQRTRGFSRALSNDSRLDGLVGSGSASPKSSRANGTEGTATGTEGTDGTISAVRFSAEVTSADALSAARLAAATSATSSVAALTAPSSMTGREGSPSASAPSLLPERWEYLLTDLISVSPDYSRKPPGLRCETKSDVLVFAPTQRGDDADGLVAVLEVVVRIARQRAKVRLSEGATTTMAGPLTTGGNSA